MVEVSQCQLIYFFRAKYIRSNFKLKILDVVFLLHLKLQFFFVLKTISEKEVFFAHLLYKVKALVRKKQGLDIVSFEAFFPSHSYQNNFVLFFHSERKTYFSFPIGRIFSHAIPLHGKKSVIRLSCCSCSCNSYAKLDSFCYNCFGIIIKTVLKSLKEISNLFQSRLAQRSSSSRNLMEIDSQQLCQMLFRVCVCLCLHSVLSMHTAFR